MTDDQILLIADTEIYGSYIVREVTNAELLAFARAVEQRILKDQLPDTTKMIEEPPNSTTDVVESEEWDHPPHRNCDCKHCKEYWTDVYQPKPDLLNQTCCECGKSGGYALYCVDCWSKASQWQGLTDENILDLQKASWVDKQAFEAVAWMIDEFLEKKNT
jgi:hypothetical protein